MDYNLEGSSKDYHKSTRNGIVTDMDI